LSLAMPILGGNPPTNASYKNMLRRRGSASRKDKELFIKRVERGLLRRHLVGDRR
jgi:hypothetical protein